MNGAHVHLMLNHIPVVLGMLVPLLLGWSLVQGGVETRRLALGLACLLGLAAIPTYLSGEPAEEIVEHVTGVSENLIEPHEEFAEIALIASVALGAAASILLIYFRRSTSIPSSAVWALLAASVVCAGLLAWTANLGGRIHHQEIQQAYEANPEP